MENLNFPEYKHFKSFLLFDSETICSLQTRITELCFIHTHLIYPKFKIHRSYFTGHLNYK